MSSSKAIEIRTEDGVVDVSVHRPDGDGAGPGVILFPDGGNRRPVTETMARRLADLGYVVLLPNIFYRSGEYAPFDPMTVFGDPAERERLMKIIRSLDMPSAMRDVGHFVRALHAEPGVAEGPIGCVGYCIGGRIAFTAAGAHPEAIGIAASIHGGGLVSDAPDSPHLSASAIRAKLYFAVADNDQSCTPEHQAKLVSALSGAHKSYMLEHYPGASHGFAMTDFPVYQAEAAERHWKRVEALFAEALPR